MAPSGRGGEKFSLRSCLAAALNVSVWVLCSACSLYTVLQRHMSSVPIRNAVHWVITDAAIAAAIIAVVTTMHNSEIAKRGNSNAIAIMYFQSFKL